VTVESLEQVMLSTRTSATMPVELLRLGD